MNIPNAPSITGNTFKKWMGHNISSFTQLSIDDIYTDLFLPTLTWTGISYR